MATHRGGTRHHASQVRHDQGRDESRRESLCRIEQHDREAEPPAVDAPHFRPADVAAPVPADVVALDEPHEPVAPRHRAEHVPGDDEERRRHSAYVGIWYFDTQSLTVDQSRLSKNASMYDARSVW